METEAKANKPSLLFGGKCNGCPLYVDCEADELIKADRASITVQ